MPHTQKFPAISTAELSGDQLLYDGQVIGTIDGIIGSGRGHQSYAIELASEFGDHEETVWYKKDAIRQLVRVYRAARLCIC